MKVRDTSAGPIDHTAFFAEHESEVRSYCRRLPSLLTTAKGASVFDVQGRQYVDLLSACGALNYGHNHPILKAAAIDYLLSDGIAAALDLHTDAKLRFISEFEKRVLVPRGLRYKMQFPGPTGTNCVEAAIKLARKATGRNVVVAFTNAFHGVSSGALSATASAASRRSARGLLHGVVRLPYDGYRGADVRDLARFEAMALDPSGGIDPVAAFIVETVQGEGGLNVASAEWLSALAATAERLGAVLIVDDIQAGCGRTGGFFSFERAGLVPDLVCLAKSIGGFGFPMSLLLIRPELDVWSPGEHNGTFRGNSLAFVTAAKALQLWTEDFISNVNASALMLRQWCDRIVGAFPKQLKHKGIGMMQGLEFAVPQRAAKVADLAARSGIIIECCGPQDEVLKVMAPLNIDAGLFASTLERLGEIVESVLLRSGAVLKLQLDEAVLDSHDHCGDSVTGTELPHRIADVEFDGLLRNG
ncbi:MULTISPECIES: diaminobutyrate--2-oxoglutarate transaminase [unclassified Bradyrhizobium]|uniref:diaminobutyrate--2-oxoglutarate transaminase n=1 Tax=unclassified Bradyrhizobium TaxID=2631580 RepID=UPI001FF7E9F5|nr:MULTISPECIES: diaminobutyrate--2-oxoglutarate transaminase [unclassified Bradyrhizobium]MCK1707733.1 diaminobutyrate--2-oxoglutarate transaminase [Bradyrhizobium sp. 143]MCK1730034.1 diaminobutyrate--2-oxoglutarate transaminase [Bradyrhizobium sp. 142]